MPAPDATALPSAPTRRVPYAFARMHGVLPLRDEGDAVLVLARADASLEGIAELKRVLQRPLKTLSVNAERFAAELAQAYNQGSAPVAQISEDLSRDTDLARLLQDIPKAEDLLGSTSDAPVIRMINALLLQALRERASDLHFEPYESRSVVRFRIDGELRDVIEPPRALHAALVSRLKVMASMDIAEKRLPQDGRMALKLGDKSVDVRVSTLPTGPGERVVLRLLDKDTAWLDLTALGMSADALSAIDLLIREPHGIVLVTGPTGSGKTTTLYAAMSRLPRGAAKRWRSGVGGGNGPGAHAAPVPTRGLHRVRQHGLSRAHRSLRVGADRRSVATVDSRPRGRTCAARGLREGRRTVAGGRRRSLAGRRHHVARRTRARQRHGVMWSSHRSRIRSSNWAPRRIRWCSTSWSI
jgi:hypothetical protein